MGTWEITLTTFVISSTQARSTERTTHDTPQSSLPQHHPTSHASPYPLPVLPKQSVAKSDTFGSKSLACCTLFPPLRVKKIYESLPTCRPLAIMLVSVMWTTKGAAKTHARARSYRSYVRAST